MQTKIEALSTVDKDTYFTVNDVAELVELSPMSVYKDTSKGYLKYDKKNGKSFLFSAKTVKEYLQFKEEQPCRPGRYTFAKNGRINRKPTKKLRDNFVMFRATTEEKEEIKKLAESNGFKNVSAFLASLVKEAKSKRIQVNPETIQFFD